LGAVTVPLLGFSTFARNMRRMFAAHSQPDTASLQQMWYVIEVHQGDRLLHLSGRFNQQRERYGERYKAALQNFTGKLCFINGLDDPNSGAHMADAFARYVPDGVLVRLPGVGHWPQLEDPHTVVTHIMRALA
jgi:pimeloyl-ACP methyl ester carboxylesterase